MIGVWILANAFACQQIVSRAIFAELGRDLRAPGEDFYPIGWIDGTKVKLADGIRVAGERTLWVKAPNELATRSQLRSNPRATPPGTPPKPRKRKKR